MAYIGNPVDTAFTSLLKQDLTGASGTSLTLSHAVANANDIALYINNVRQEPTEAYSVNGTTVTLTGTVAGTDDIYVIYLARAIQTTVPPDGSVSTAKIANNAVNLTSKVTGVLPVANGGTGFSTRPAFATIGTNYSQSSNAYSIIIPNSETFDTGNDYNASTGVFTTPVNGLYMFGFWGLSYPHTGHANTVAYHKNGTIVGQGIQQTGDSAQHNLSSGSLLLQLSATDTIDLRYFQNTSSGSSAKAYSTQWNMYGYLIG